MFTSNNANPPRTVKRCEDGVGEQMPVTASMTQRRTYSADFAQVVHFGTIRVC